jgi:hypothetical protein
MRLLTATRERQGERAGDFCYTIEGELVLAGFVCATDENDPDGGCGCGRAFSGMSSMRATTTAMVRDLDVSIEDVRLAAQGYYAASGLHSEDFASGAEFTQFMADTVDELAEIAASLPVGAVVGRRLNRLVWRSETSGVGEH